jgi:FG-GAP-like repeat
MHIDQKNRWPMTITRKVRAAFLGALSFASVFALSGCGGGGGGDAPAPVSAAPTVVVNSETSYANYKGIGLVPQSLPAGYNFVRAFGNFVGNGRQDLFRAVQTYNVSLPAAQATSSRFEFYSKQADGSFKLNTAVMPQTNGCLHPRKAVVADFNKDGRADIFVACHGYDAAPFPGEKTRLF